MRKYLRHCKFWWSFLTLVIMVLGVQPIFSQNRTVTGKVTSDLGETLPGVSVVKQGTTTGTITDSDGVYSIQVNNNDVLQFSFIGYVTEAVPVDNQDVINITMIPSLEHLTEVVIVGFGKQSREVVSSSITKVNTDEVVNTTSVDPIQALQGKVAGLNIQVNSGQPGQAARVFIRGGTSPDPSGNVNQPLYIIDGVFRDGLDGLNPNDIESIQVLKDAAATSIYGARAANGIILITTKTGEGVDGSNVTFKYTFGVENLAKTYPWTSAADYVRASRIAAARGINLENPGERLEGTKFGYSAQTGYGPGEYGFGRNTLTYMDELVGVEGQAYVDDLLQNQGFETLEDPATGRTLIFKDNNYDDLMFNTATSHNFNLGFNGGNSVANYNVGLGFIDQEGIFSGTGAKRFSFLANGGYKVRDNLKIDAGVSFQFNDTDAVESGDVVNPQGVGGNPLTRANNALNRSSRLPHTLRIRNDDGTPALGESTSSPRNREHELFYQDITEKTTRNTWRFGADWEVIKGLSFRPSFSIYREEFVYNFFERASPAIPGRRMRRIDNNFNQLMLNGLLNYDATFGNDHNLNLIGGLQFTKEVDERFLADGGSAPTDLISTLNASAQEQERAVSTIFENRLISYFGRATYDFDAKYLFSTSLRVDGSSRFAEDNKFAVFPAFSAGWNVHQEGFWGSSLLNTFKIRASWGQAGNLSNLVIQDTQGEFATTGYAGNGGVINSRLANTGLVWETTSTFDAGFDLGILNRFTLFVDFYNKITSDRLIDRPLGAQTGFADIKDNFGTLRNRGIEIEISADIINEGDFRWHADLNFAFNRRTVVELPDNGNPKNRIEGGIIWDENGNEIQVGGLAEGERPGEIWAFDRIGVYATDADAAEAPEDILVSGSKVGEAKNGGDAIWRDVNGDNTIDQRDLVFVGYRNPDKQGGLVNTFTWKGFTFRLAVDFTLGHKINNGWKSRSLGNGRNNVMTVTDVLGGEIWKEQGDQATLPRYDNASDFDNGYRNYNRFLSQTSNGNLGHRNGGNGGDVLQDYTDGNFLAFRELSLHYAISPKLSDKIGLKNASISFAVYNLGFITEYDGLTPEIYDVVDEGQFPRPRQFNFGFQTSF